MIENGIARFDIAQKINQRNLIALRTRERAHDEVEIRGGKPRPTIRPDHRDFIMRDPRGDGKPDCTYLKLLIWRPGIQENRMRKAGTQDTSAARSTSIKCC